MTIQDGPELPRQGDEEPKRPARPAAGGRRRGGRAALRLASPGPRRLGHRVYLARVRGRTPGAPARPPRGGGGAGGDGRLARRAGQAEAPLTLGGARWSASRGPRRGRRRDASAGGGPAHQAVCAAPPAAGVAGARSGRGAHHLRDRGRRRGRGRSASGGLPMRRRRSAQRQALEYGRCGSRRVRAGCPCRLDRAPGQPGRRARVPPAGPPAPRRSRTRGPPPRPAPKERRRRVRRRNCSETAPGVAGERSQPAEPAGMRISEPPVSNVRSITPMAGGALANTSPFHNLGSGTGLPARSARPRNHPQAGPEIVPHDAFHNGRTEPAPVRQPPRARRPVSRSARESRGQTEGRP